MLPINVVWQQTQFWRHYSNDGQTILVIIYNCINILGNWASFTNIFNCSDLSPILIHKIENSLYVEPNWKCAFH